MTVRFSCVVVGRKITSSYYQNVQGATYTKPTFQGRNEDGHIFQKFPIKLGNETLSQCREVSFIIYNPIN